MTERTLLTVVELERINQCSAHGALRVSEMLARAAIVAADQDHAKRLAAHQCRYCYYLNHGLAGQAFTDWRCVLCGLEAQHHNTNVPRVCVPCADGFSLCVTCGGDLQQRHRSRRFGRKRARSRHKGAR